MQIDQVSFFLPGNVHSRTAAVRATSAEAAGQVIDPRALTSLRRALRFVRPAILDFAGWRRLRRSDAAWPAAAVAEVVALIVQRYVGWPVAFSGYSPAGEGRRAQAAATATASRQERGTAVFQAKDEHVGKAAAEAGFAVARALVDGIDGPELRVAIRAALRGFLTLTMRVTPAVDTLLLASMAEERGLPWHVVSRSRFVRVGLGRHACMLKGTESTRISSIGAMIAKDKSMANRMLADLGLPVPEQRTADTEEAAVTAGQELGYPLVVKPFNGNMGRDVTVGVSSDDEMRTAFARAVVRSDKAVIETLIRGDETRLLVADGKLLAAMNRQPAQVVGDGARSVGELVRAENRRPERDTVLNGVFRVMKPILLDDDALLVLAQQGLDLNSVPPAGQRVLLRRESNLSRGGRAVDVTDRVHPSIRRVAEAASRALHLDVCGVDFLTTDLTRPWDETGGAICEVNSRPGVHSQINAIPPDRRGAVVEGIFDALMGKGGTCGLPVAALVGEPESTWKLLGTLEKLAESAGRTLGIVGEAERLSPSSRHLQNAAELFQADDIDAALIVLKPRDLLERGLGLPRLAAAVMSPDLGARSEAVRRLLGRVTGGEVLSADDPAVLERAAAALDLTPTPTPTAS